MRFRTSFQRSIEVELGSQKPGKGFLGKGFLLDQVHNIGVIADIAPDGTMTDFTPGSTSRPFPPCLDVIAGSGRSVWQGKSLRDPEALRAGWRQAQGCEHVAEIVNRLALAFAHEMAKLRLELKATLSTNKGEELHLVKPGDRSMLTVALKSAADGVATAELQINVPVTHAEWGVRAKPEDSRVVGYSHIPETLIEKLRRKNTREGIAALAGEEQDLEAVIVRDLLRLYEETRAAIFSPPGSSVPLNPDGRYRAMVARIQGGKSTIRCGAFGGRGIGTLKD